MESVKSGRVGINNTVYGNVNKNYSSAEIKTPTFDFTESSWRTDFCLVVEGTKLYVSKTILSLASPVFDTLFQSDFKEKSCDELELPGKKLSDVIEFLRCIYPNKAAEINRDNAMALLPLLEEYQVLQHKPRCEAVLVESIAEETTTEELLEMLKQACTYELRTLRARCISLISSRPCDEKDYSYCKSFISTEAFHEILLKANASMKNKLAELAQLTEENELLKRCVTSELLAKSKGPQKKWDDKTITLIGVIPRLSRLSVENESEGEVAEIWGIPFKITILVSGKTLNCTISNIGQMKVTCEFAAHGILVNRQPNGRNELFHYNGSFYGLYQRDSHEISRDVEFTNSLDGKVDIILQLLVSQPYLTKK